MTETKTRTVSAKELNDSLDSLGEKVLRCKRERDVLLEACRAALDEMEHLEESDHLSYFDLDKLRSAIALAEEP